MSSYRKKWEQSSSGAAPQIASKTPVPSQNVHTIAYDQYLATLQERNRYVGMVTSIETVSCKFSTILL